jgi:hypothetical protein
MGDPSHHRTPGADREHSGCQQPVQGQTHDQRSLVIRRPPSSFRAESGRRIAWRQPVEVARARPEGVDCRSAFARDRDVAPTPGAEPRRPYRSTSTDVTRSRCTLANTSVVITGGKLNRRSCPLFRPPMRLVVIVLGIGGGTDAHDPQNNAREHWPHEPAARRRTPWSRPNSLRCDAGPGQRPARHAIRSQATPREPTPARATYPHTVPLAARTSLRMACEWHETHRPHDRETFLLERAARACRVTVPHPDCRPVVATAIRPSTAGRTSIAMTGSWIAQHKGECTTASASPAGPSPRPGSAGLDWSLGRWQWRSGHRWFHGARVTLSAP